MVSLSVMDYIFNGISAVNQTSRNGNLFTGLIDFVSDYITYARKSDKNSTSVCITKSTLYVIFLIEVGIYRVVLFCFNGNLFDEFISHIDFFIHVSLHNSV